MKSSRPARRVKSSPRAEELDSSPILGVEITHPDRVLFPECGVTKLELARYYATVAPFILPHVAGRPLMMVRCPTGRGGACFYQKHLEGDPPPGTHVVKIKESKGSLPYLVIDEPVGLVSLVQRGVLEFHTWQSREPDIEHADRVVFDLDPAPGVGWDTMANAARMVKSLLIKGGMKPVVMLSGGKGVHVAAHWNGKGSWDAVKGFAHDTAVSMAAAEPDKYVATMSKEKRTGKIFIDYLRNGRGSTSVVPFSTRLRENAPVAMPIRWSELDNAGRADAFNVRTALTRMNSRARDPWSELNDIPAATTRTSVKRRSAAASAS